MTGCVTNPTETITVELPVGSKISGPVAKPTREGTKVIIDPEVSADWNVVEAISLWNDLLPCDYFYFRGPAKRTLYIVESNEEADNYGEDYAGFHEFISPTNERITLNAYYGYNFFVPLHELGHSLGLEHSDEGIMAESVTDSQSPSAQEVALAAEGMVC